MKPHHAIQAVSRQRRMIGATATVSNLNSISCKHQQHRSFSSLRRPRKYECRAKAVGSMPAFGKLQEPYQHGEDSLEDYLKKTSLSPWAPIPDSVARRMLDLAKAGPTDFHVDLGSGDGRVNFHAIDYGVPKSLGVDVDETIVQVARDRLAKRHPQPDLEFVVADLLMDTEHKVWNKIQDATIITMYFAEEALRMFRPVLERKLAGRQCKILTCGYEMPGWQSRLDEVVLGTQIHLYEWGTEIDDDEEALELFMGEDILQKKPDAFLRQIEGTKFAGSTVIDRTNKFQIQGYNPNLKVEEEDDEEDWDAVSSDDDEEKQASKPKELKKKTATPCSKK
jgi:hypothetical protein